MRESGESHGLPLTGDEGGQREREVARHDVADEGGRRLRRYTYLITIAVFLACNAVVFGGLWMSGVNLETLYRTPDVFDPGKDICLRQSWHKVRGMAQPIQLCYEWINTSDPSGLTHTFQPDTAVVKGADGRLYFDYGPRVDYRLFLVVVFVVGVLAASIKIQRAMIDHFRSRLDEEGDLRIIR